VKTYSEELRFTSNVVGGFSWITGAYFVHTERFISTGNLVDRGLGVPPVYQITAMGTIRLDYQLIGRTWWDPYDLTPRDPVNLINLRASGFHLQVLKR
jgi:hypothetical protein